MQDHVILNYLDRPLKILIWPVSTVAAVVSPILICLLIGKPLWGVTISVAIGFGITEYKRRFGSNTLIGLAYWLLPHRNKDMPMTPPSYIREYLG